MSFSKAHRFDPSDYHFALLCKALSHPSRIAILRKLINRNSEKLAPGFLYSGMPISRSSFSEHLKTLRDMHIVRCEGMGPRVTYWLNPELPNTYWGIIYLIFQSDKKYDGHFKEEIPFVSGRRTLGAVPV